MARAVIRQFNRMVSAAESGLVPEDAAEQLINTLSERPGAMMKRRGFVHTTIEGQGKCIYSMYGVKASDDVRRIVMFQNSLSIGELDNNVTAELREATSVTMEDTDYDRTIEPDRRE